MYQHLKREFISSKFPQKTIQQLKKLLFLNSMATQKQEKDYLYLAYKGKEYLWLGFTILSILISAYFLIKSDGEQALYFIALTFLAGLLYSIGFLLCSLRGFAAF